MAALFVPGKLTKKYFLGKHKSYSNPLQLFLVPAFFLFALVSWNISKIDFGDNAIVRLKEDLDWIEFYEKLDDAKLQTDSLFSDSIAMVATDTLRHRLKKYKPELEDSLKLGNFGELHEIFRIPAISKKDLLTMSSDEIVEQYGKDKSFIGKLVLGQASKFKEGGGKVIEYFFSKLTITLLLMMPILALILKLFYIRHDYYYVEHLIFTLHIHAFIFIVILLLILTGKYLGGFIAIPIIGIFIYLYLAMKKVYQQSGRKTFLKFIGIYFSYPLLAGFFSLAAIFISFLLF